MDRPDHVVHKCFHDTAWSSRLQLLAELHGHSRESGRAECREKHAQWTP